MSRTPPARRDRPRRAHAPARAVPHRQGRGVDRRGRRRVRRHARPDARDGREAHRHRPARRRRLLADGRTSCSTSTGICSTSATSSSSPTRSGSSASPKLTAREAAALLAGLQLARTIPGVGDTDLFAGLLAKLARGASSTPAEVIVAPGPVDEVRDARRRGPAARGSRSRSPTRLRMPRPTTRTVDPVKVHIADGQWYLQGWCHLRQAMRTFHLDRVSDLELTDIPITHGEEPVPGWFEPDAGDVVARIRFPESVAPLLGRLPRPRRRSRPPTACRSRRCASPTSSACGASPLAAAASVEILEPDRGAACGRRRGPKRVSRSTADVPRDRLGARRPRALPRVTLGPTAPRGDRHVARP